jgi:GT2 family glycosyltransferase
MTNSKNVDVSVIVVNYRTKNQTKDCIDSVIKFTQKLSYEIIVVDNSCDKLEFDFLYDTFKQNAFVKILNADRNLGFGQANNLAASFATGKYILFLNSDTLIIDNSIFNLFSCISKNSSIGVVGGYMFGKNNEIKDSYSPKELTLTRFYFKNSMIYALLSRSVKRFSSSPKKRDIEISGYICGADLMISKVDFDKLNGFDNRIFMYAEDALLCWKVIHLLHKKIMVVHSSNIIHFEGGSDNQVFSFKKINAWVDGHYIYFSTAFSSKVAKHFLKMAIWEFRIKKIAFIILNNKIKVKNYSNFIISLQNKLKELNC